MFSPLHARNVGAMKAREFGELFLGDARPLTDLPELFSKANCYIGQTEMLRRGPLFGKD
jgi:hypothetical protein